MDDPFDDLGTSRVEQSLQFVEGGLHGRVGATRQLDTDDHRRLDATDDVDALARGTLLDDLPATTPFLGARQRGRGLHVLELLWIGIRQGPASPRVAPPRASASQSGSTVPAATSSAGPVRNTDG